MTSSKLIADGDRTKQRFKILDSDLDEAFAEPIGRKPAFTDTPTQGVDADTVEKSGLLERDPARRGHAHWRRERVGQRKSDHTQTPPIVESVGCVAAVRSRR